MEIYMLQLETGQDPRQEVFKNLQMEDITWTQVLGAPLAGFVSGRGCDLELAANGDIYASLGTFSEGRIYRSSFAVNGIKYR